MYIPVKYFLLLKYNKCDQSHAGFPSVLAMEQLSIVMLP